MTIEHVNAVLAAWNSAREGEAVGVVKRNDDTGFIAHRVEDGGVIMWKVSSPSGQTYSDMQANLPWTQIYPI